MPFLKTLLASVMLFSVFYMKIAVAKEVALTIDDLPFVGSSHNDEGKLRREHDRFLKILSILEKYKIPATGFIIANSIETGQWELLEQFRNAGNTLGNHTFSHRSLSRVSSAVYIEDIDKADRKLAPLLTTPKYFRYPYLSEGVGTKKYSEVRQYLEQHQYTVAPVTIDSKDYQFNARLLNIPWRERAKYLNGFKHRYLNYIWNKTLKAERNAELTEHRPIKHILLLHMSYLNSYFMEDIIKLFQEHGYRFIPLDEAMKDPYYKAKGG